MEARLHSEEFILAATIEPNVWHKSGSLTEANRLLATYPNLPQTGFINALVYGELELVQLYLMEDPSLANKKQGPRDWEPILYVCFSQYLRLSAERQAHCVACAKLLLETGADPNAYFMANEEKETAIYGAIGIANSVDLGRALLQAGADLDDDEVYYHGAEFDGVEALAMMIEEFGIPDRHKSTALIRKLDFEDLEGVRRLLSLGLDPNAQGHWGKNALHQALLRFRSTAIIELLLTFDADPNAAHANGQTAYQMAARMGRTDVLAAMEAAGANTKLSPKDEFLAACTRADRAAANYLIAQNPEIITSLDPQEDYRLLVDCAQRNQIEVVKLMLDLGFPIEAKDEQGFTALLVTTWNGHVDLMEELLQRNAPLEILNKYGGTVIDTTVWGYSHYPDPDKPMEFILQRLIDEGANLKAISPYPTKDPRIDGFLSQYLS
ncbi:MAG: ankyrin repeat domain-containing protein [Bacteroidota bacterium]